MSQAPNAKPDYTLHVDWYQDGEPRRDFLLSEVAVVLRLIEEHGLWLHTITSDCPSLSELLDRLAPLASDEYDEITVNGTTVGVASRLGGGLALVPLYGEGGTESLGKGVASWLSGGPCVFDQSEELCRLDDLYWVNTWGDVEHDRIVVGRFTDPAKGLAAAVEASYFFRFDEHGSLVCDLDEWPQEE